MWSFKLLPVYLTYLDFIRKFSQLEFWPLQTSSENYFTKNLSKLLQKIVLYYLLTMKHVLAGSWTADSIWKCIWKRCCGYSSCKFHHSTLCISFTTKLYPRRFLHFQNVSERNSEMSVKCQWKVLWFMVEPETSDIRMTYEEIRMTYGSHTRKYESHKNGIRMACKIILNCI